MRKVLESLLVLACLCSSGFAQNGEARRAELRHLTVPDYAQIADGQAKTPLEFLFSEDGDDIYSATWFDKYHQSLNALLDSSRLGGTSGMRFIVVYQDEAARQKTIANLRKPHVMAEVAVGHHAPLENLKFSVVHVLQGSIDHKLEYEWAGKPHSEKENRDFELEHRRWAVAEIDYFEPQACETHPHQDVCVERGVMVPCLLPGLHAASVSDNWIGDLNIDPGKFLEPYDDPQYVRIIETMRAKVKEFAARTLNLDTLK